MTNIERYTEQLGIEISEVWETSLEKAIKAGTEMLNGTQTDEELDTFYTVAQRIVEPSINDSEVEEEYHSFMENDIDNWVSFITQHLGSRWGYLASVVKEYGY